MDLRRPSSPAPIPSTVSTAPVASSDALEALAAIGPIARSSVMDAVADRLRDEILSGRLAAGSRLPSEREFALSLGVNRLTLRAALARLEAAGLVVTRHGAGTVVASWRERAGLDALAALIGASWQSGGFAPASSGHELLTSMLEVRRIVCSEAVGLAAERHAEADLAVMAELARAQEARVHDRLAFARGDIAFERAVVRATRNVGLELLLNTFARFPDEQPGVVAELYDQPEASLPFYPLTIELIRGRDRDTARETLRRVLEAADAAWSARHEARPASKSNGAPMKAKAARVTSKARSSDRGRDLR